MSQRLGFIDRLRTGFGLILCGIIFIFSGRETQILVLDFLATKFRKFRGESEKFFD